MFTDRYERGYQWFKDEDALDRDPMDPPRDCFHVNLYESVLDEVPDFSPIVIYFGEIEQTDFDEGEKRVIGSYVTAFVRLVPGEIPVERFVDILASFHSLGGSEEITPDEVAEMLENQGLKDYSRLNHLYS